MNKTVIRTLLFTFLAVLISINVTAQKKLEKITKSGIIKVGMTGNQPPFSMEAKDGSLIGYEVDLAELLAESMNLKLEVIQLPFNQLLTALQNGDVDVVMSGMTITTERNLKVAFIGPYMLSGKSILTKSTTLAKVEEAEELNQKNLKVSALSGSTSEKFVKMYLPDAQLMTVNDYNGVVKKLMNDEVAILVADYPVCVMTMLRYPDANLAISDPFTIEPIGIAVPPNDPLFMNFIENYFSALQLAGVLDALETYWFEDGSWMMNVK